MAMPIDCHLNLRYLHGTCYQLELTLDDYQAPGPQRLLGQTTDDTLVDLASLTIADADPIAQGRRLGSKLFAKPEAKQALTRLLTVLEKRTEPIRLRLECDSSLYQLPWEALDFDGNGPISLRQQIRFSRYHPTDSDRPLAEVTKGRLRVVTAIADPTNLDAYGLAPIDRQRYESDLIRALPLAAHIPTKATLDDIFYQLRQGAEIFYLVAHGYFGRGEPVLYLRDDAGIVDAVPVGKWLGELGDLGALPRLVVLISCESAGNLDAEDSHLNALGPRFVQAGVPAVVAMKGQLSLKTAHKLVPTFFASLLEDGYVDRALAYARQGVAERHDAWLPLLFSRLRTGQLWQPDELKTMGILGQRVVGSSQALTARLSTMSQEVADLAANWDREPDLQIAHQNTFRPFKQLSADILAAAQGTERYALRMLLAKTREQIRQVRDNLGSERIAALYLGQIHDTLKQINDRLKQWRAAQVHHESTANDE